MFTCPLSQFSIQAWHTKYSWWCVWGVLQNYGHKQSFDQMMALDKKSLDHERDYSLTLIRTWFSEPNLMSISKIVVEIFTQSQKCKSHAGAKAKVSRIHWQRAAVVTTKTLTEKSLNFIFFSGYLLKDSKRSVWSVILENPKLSDRQTDIVVLRDMPPDS